MPPPPVDDLVNGQEVAFALIGQITPADRPNRHHLENRVGPHGETGGPQQRVQPCVRAVDPDHHELHTELLCRMPGDGPRNADPVRTPRAPHLRLPSFLLALTRYFWRCRSRLSY